MLFRPTIKEKELYADFRKDFEQNPINDDLSRITNERAVEDSIRNLIMTDPGERLMQPNIGCGVRKMLFDLITPDALLRIRDMVTLTIESYEPRVILQSVNVTASLDSNYVVITIHYTMINTEEAKTLTVTLERVR